ncbi:MAG: hypothetical protein QOH12_2348 [Solirubrobacteraceae bacterium]|nr:hypothetical protein [Solirubrobacteraceae bacterium]
MAATGVPFATADYRRQGSRFFTRTFRSSADRIHVHPSPHHAPPLPTEIAGGLRAASGRRALGWCLLGIALLWMALAPAASRAAVPATVNCSDPATQQITGQQNALSLVGPGSWCIHDATVSGYLKVTGGANVKILNSVVNGAVHATQGGSFAVCASQLNAALVISQASGFVLLGGRAGSQCAPNTFSTTSVAGSTAGVEISGNVFNGSLSVSDTSGGTVISGNTFNSSVTCTGNQPPPTDTGVRNRGSGALLHQCAMPRSGTVEHATNDSYTATQDNTLLVPAPGVLANDSDSAGNPLTAMLVSGPAHGSLTLNADGSFSYTPSAGYHGPDSFTYQANDGIAASNTATVSIRVDAPPVAVADAYSVSENAVLTILAPGVLGNDSDADADPITAILAAGPAHGSLTLNADGSFTYTPTANFFGSDSFTYRATDGFASSTPATVTITVNGAPTVVNHSYATNKGVVLSVVVPGVLAGSTDPGGHEQAAVVTSPTHGTLALNADGSFTYTPNSGYSGPDSFTFKAVDQGLDSNVATATIKVNAPPVAVNDSYAVLQNGTLNEPAAGGVLINDSDSDGDAFHAVLSTTTTHGTLTLNPDGSFSYTPTAGYHGPDSFTYQASDGSATSNTATVSIRVDAPPVAVADAYSVDQNVTLAPAAPGVLGNDTDPDADTLTAVLVTGTTHGSLTLNPNGSFTYTPTANFVGSDSFTYRASDGFASSAPATVTITVNGAPTVVNHSYTTNEGVVLSVLAPGVLAGSTDPGGHEQAVVVTNPTHGTLALSADGSFTYTPNSGYSGPDSFTFKAHDGTLDSNVATATIKVNAPPAANNDFYTVLQNGTLNQPAPGVLGNDTDADADPLTATIVAGPAHGSLTLNPNGSFSYTPTAGYHGPDSFTYQANDATASSNTATVSIRVDAPPVAVNDSYTLDQNSPRTVGAPGVLANDTDPDADPLTAVLAAGPAHGSLTLNSNGSFTYTPTAGYSGPDSFTYKANDGFASSNVATVSLTVNAAPSVVNHSYTTNRGVVLSVPAPGVLAGSTDPGGSEQAAVVTGPAHGSLTLNTDGSFTYTPTAGYSGPDSFTFKAHDGTLDSNVATASIKVNAPPVAVNDSYTVLQNGSLTQPVAGGVLSNDTDSDADTLTASTVTGPAHGSLTLNTDGSFTYTPTAGYHGPDSFTYKANDATASSNTATVSIRVDAPPVAANDSYTVAENTPLSIATPGVLANDSDPDGDPITAVLAAGPAHGSLTLNPNGSFTYAPATNFLGADSFTYKASDGFADSNVVTVSLTVNAAPSVVNHSYTTNRGVVLSVPAPGVLAGSTDPGGSEQAAVVTGPTHGSLTLNTDGSFTYTPTAGYSGPDSFTYKATDQGLDSNVGTAAIKVNAPPVAVNDSYTVLQNGTLTQAAAGGVLSNDTDSDGDALTATVVAGPAHGSLTLNTDGSFTYTPTAGYHGPDSFTYKANDATASSNTATVSIRVDAPPVAVNDSYVGTADQTLAVTAAAGVLANDTDADTDPLTAALVSSVSHGTLTLNADGSFTYVPAGGFHGSDSFTYKANDGFADSNVATVSIRVDAAPVAVNDAYSIAQNGTLTVPAAGVLTNDTDADADAIHAVLVANVAHGTLSLAADGSFTYTPTPGFFGADSFTYKANDGTLDSNVATVSITVVHVNQPPVNTVPGAQSVTTNTTLVFNTAHSNTLSVADPDASAPDVEQIALSVSHGKVTLAAGSGVSVTGGADGSASVTIQGTLAQLNAALNGLTYTPTTSYFGADTLVMVTDDLGHNGTGGAKTATSNVAITVIPAPPTVVAQSYTGAVGNTKFEVAAAAGTGPEVFRSGNALTGDSDPNGGTLSVTAATIASAHGGSVTMAADGTFVYLPAAGFAGSSDTFNYTVNTSEGTSATAQATINFSHVGERIWYVNGNATTNGDGRSSSPFNTLAAFGAGRPDASGDIIFVYRRTAGPYPGGITLLATEVLIGQSLGLQNGADVLVPASGANPQITNAAGDGIDVANFDAVGGIDVVNASAAGVAGTGNINNVTVDAAAPGAITGSGGAGFSLTSGNGSVSVGASISGSTGPAVSIAGRTGGTVALSGAISGNAISLTSNGGTTINFTGALTISSGAGTAFLASNGGTVTATANTNTLTSTTGRALDVVSTTIGAGGLEFQSVSSNGAPNGIRLDTTGASGSLTVTGNGGTCTAADTSGCSGGQIQNSVGGDDSSAAPVGTGVVLKDTLSPSLTRIWIHDAGNYGIHGSNVAGFALDQSVINGTNGTNSATPFNDASVRFNNLTGSATVSNDAISGGFTDNFNVTNTSGDLNRITFTSDTVGDNSAAGGNDGLALLSSASAGALKATIQGSTFTGAAGDLVDYGHGGSGLGDLVISGSHFSNSHPGIATGGGGLTLTNSGTSGATTMSITGNTFRDAVGNGLTIVKSTGTSTQVGTFASNTIGVAGNTTLGSSAGDGIKLQSAGQGTMTWQVTNNQIYGFANFGVDVLAGGGATAQSGTVNATVTGNTIANPAATGGFPTNGLQFNIGTVAAPSPGDTFNACLQIGGAGALANTVNGTGTNGAPDIRPRQRQGTTIRLPGYGGSPTDDTAVDTFVAGNNKVSPTVTASHNVPPGGGFTGTGTTCP